MNSHRGDSYRYESSGSRSGDDRGNAPVSRCIGVFGLSMSTRDRDLYDFFSRYGRVHEARIVYDNKTGQSRRYGFVTFALVRSAVDARDHAHGREILGHPIRIDFSFTEGPHAPTPGMYLGRPTRDFQPRSRPYEDHYRSYDDRSSSYRTPAAPYRYREFQRRSSPRPAPTSRSRSPLSNRRRHLSDRLNPPASRCVGVFGISPRTRAQDVQDIFSRYGAIEKVHLVTDGVTGRSRGFAFVYFVKEEDAKEAKERAAGTEIDGQEIRCDFSVTERAHSPTPGVYLGRPTFERSRSPTERNGYRHSRDSSYERR